MTLKWKREAAGHYVSSDNRFRVFKDTSTAANMWGQFSEPWELTDRGRDAGTYHTLRDAKTAAERRAQR